MKSLFKYVKILIPIFVLILLALFFRLWLNGNSFDETIMDENNIYDHIDELTQKEYNGRLAGSDGNDKAIEYIADFFEENGIEPAGENGTYYQQFSTIVPQIDTHPVFNVKSSTGEIVKEFEMYLDYKIVPSMHGDSVDFYGDLIFVGSNLFRIDKELIKDRVVVIHSSIITFEKANYVLQHGGKGILCNYDKYSYGARNKYVMEKSLNISGKTGESILIGFISLNTYSYFTDYIDNNNVERGDYYTGIVPNVEIKASIDFPVVTTANVLGKIEGKVKNGRILLITANIDGGGEGTNGQYFPGAISSVSGIAALMETARVIQNQKNLPYETIIFIGFNAQQQQLSGSGYYINYPLYPLEKTTIVHLENLGERTIEGTKLFSDNINSAIIKNVIANYAKDADLIVTSAGISYSAINKFADKKIPAVMIGDLFFKLNSYDDTLENVDKSTLKNSELVLLEFIKRDIYKDIGVDYLGKTDILIILLFVLIIAFNYIVTMLYKAIPNKKIGEKSIEDIYYANFIAAFRKAYYYITPLVLSIFLLAFLANINPVSNIRTINNETVTNFSLYSTVKNSVFYLKSVFDFSTANLDKSANLIEVIFKSSGRTIKLMGSALVLATILGILRGTYEGYKAKKGNIRSLVTLTVFSIPDVLIVLVGMLLYIYISQNFPGVKEVVKLNDFVLPLIALSIIPTIYISRISFIAIEDEIKKEYIKNAKAKGFSRKRIFIIELFPAIIFKIVDTLPAIITMILSNMIIVEYLFNYNGIVYYLLYFFKRQDINGFMAMSIILGTIFTVFTLGIKFIARQINPLKKEEKNEKK